MGKKIPLFAFFIVCLLLTGCSASRSDVSPSAPVLVTQVQVCYVHESAEIIRCYTMPEKMDTVLKYVYALRPHCKDESLPDHFSGDRCRITLTLSDGQSRTYRLYGGRFFSDDGSTWHTVELKQPSALLFLLSQMDSDEKA